MSNHQMPLKFTNKEEMLLKRTKGDGFTFLDVVIDKGAEHLPILKLEDSEDFGLRLHVYPTPWVEEPVTIPLNSYRDVSTLNLSDLERATAEDKLLDVYEEIDYQKSTSSGENTVRELHLNGTIGIKNLSDYEIMIQLGYTDVREFKKDLSNDE